MQRGRLVGVIVGFAMLPPIFLLPFSNAVTGPNSPPDTLFNIFRLYVANVSAGQNLYAAFIYQLAAILLIVAALVGLYPLGSGILGAVGLGFVTFGPYELFPNYSFASSNFGTGFYILWVLSAVQIVMGGIILRIGRRSRYLEASSLPSANVSRREEEMEVEGEAAAPEQPSASSQGEWVACPSCGASNPPTARVCYRCAAPL